jgi:hypothetical protein
MFKRSSRVLVVMIVVLQLFGGFLVGVQQLVVERVEAQACANFTLGRCEREGYFTGLHLEYDSPGDPVPPPGCITPPYGFTCGIWQNTDYLGVTNAAQFIAVVGNNLNLNFDACRGTAPMPNFFGVGWSLIDTDWDLPDPIHTCFKNKARATHAGFLIWSMMGRNGPDFGNTPDSNYTGVQFGKLAFAEWSNLVNWYASNGFANFNAFVAPPCIGGFATQTFNVIRYGQDVGFVTSFGCAPPADTILFSIPGGGTFEINKSCANVKGPITPLTYDFVATPFAQDPILTPNDAPATAEFHASLTLNRQAGPLTVDRRYFIRRGGVDLLPFASFSSSATYNAGATTAPFDYTQNGIPGLLMGDEVCQRLTVSPAAGKVDPAGNVVNQTDPSEPAEACTRLLQKPYSKVYGGDVMAGAGFGPGCAVDGDAALLGFNRPIGALNAYVGAGAQLAAHALGQILDYSSSQVLTPLNPHALSLANSGAGYASTTYGGDFGTAYAACAPDYYAGAASPAGSGPIGGQTLPLGNRQTVYVNGDAFIKDNILYAGGSYASIGQIPSFRLIVRGNIFVDSNVTQLNGLYVAQTDPANPATTGRFYSCADESWVVARRPVFTPARLTVDCANTLTVYGAVAADNIKLTRTRGTLGQASTAERYNTAYAAGQGPAEIFVYSPESWLSGELASPNSSYDSINLLPPIL